MTEIKIVYAVFICMRNGFAVKSKFVLNSGQIHNHWQFEQSHFGVYMEKSLPSLTLTVLKTDKLKRDILPALNSWLQMHWEMNLLET